MGKPAVLPALQREVQFFFTWKFAYRVAVLIGGAIIGITGPPREARQARLGPCLDFEN